MNKSFMVRVGYVYPPIPIRTMDWCAYEDGKEEDRNYGYGKTPGEALAELAAIIDEREES